MRILAAIAATINLLTFIIMIIVPELDDANLSWGLWYLWLVLSHLLIIVALLGGLRDSWLSLYFKRKAAEEKAKIKKLEDTM